MNCLMNDRDTEHEQAELGRLCCDVLWHRAGQDHGRDHSWSSLLLARRQNRGFWRCLPAQSMTAAVHRFVMAAVVAEQTGDAVSQVSSNAAPKGLVTHSKVDTFIRARIHWRRHEAASTSRSSCDSLPRAAMSVLWQGRAGVSNLLLSDARLSSAPGLNRDSEVLEACCRSGDASGQYGQKRTGARFSSHHE
jgi:hypothetical protein